MEQTKRIDYWYITNPEKDWKGCPVTEVTDDPSYKLAQMCEKSTFADLPAADVERAKKAMLDTAACMMLGSTTGFVPAMVETEKPFLTKGEGKVFFYDNETTAIEAAVPNSSIAGVAKYSDVHLTGGAGMSVVYCPDGIEYKGTARYSMTLCALMVLVGTFVLVPIGSSIFAGLV